MTEKWTSVSTPYVLPRAEGQSDVWTAVAPGRAGQRLIEVTTRRPPSHAVEALNLNSESLAVVRRRLILLDGEPVELADSYYPAQIATGTALSAKKKIKGGAPAELARLGYHPCRVVEEVEQRPARADEAAALNLTSGEPVLTLLRTCFAGNGVPYEVSLMVMKAPRRLRYELEVD